MNALDLIAANLAKPITHHVVTAYENGRTRVHGARSLAQADTYAIGERRKIGRSLVDRETGATVRVVTVTITRA